MNHRAATHSRLGIAAFALACAATLLSIIGAAWVSTQSAEAGAFSLLIFMMGFVWSWPILLLIAVISLFTKNRNHSFGKYSLGVLLVLLASVIIWVVILIP